MILWFNKKAKFHLKKFHCWSCTQFVSWVTFSWFCQFQGVWFMVLCYCAEWKVLRSLWLSSSVEKIHFQSQIWEHVWASGIIVLLSYSCLPLLCLQSVFSAFSQIESALPKKRVFIPAVGIIIVTKEIANLSKKGVMSELNLLQLKLLIPCQLWGLEVLN